MSTNSMDQANKKREGEKNTHQTIDNNNNKYLNAVECWIFCIQIVMVPGERERASEKSTCSLTLVELWKWVTNQSIPLEFHILLFTV